MGSLHSFRISLPFCIIRHPVFDETITGHGRVVMFHGRTTTGIINNHRINHSGFLQTVCIIIHIENRRIFTWFADSLSQARITVIQFFPHSVISLEQRILFIISLRSADVNRASILTQIIFKHTDGGSHAVTCMVIHSPITRIVMPQFHSIIHTCQNGFLVPFRLRTSFLNEQTPIGIAGSIGKQTISVFIHNPLGSITAHFQKRMSSRSQIQFRMILTKSSFEQTETRFKKQSHILIDVPARIIIVFQILNGKIKTFQYIFNQFGTRHTRTV
ncbi:hypothetical protein IMSAGC004_02134 [Bacteroidaceae bacterium]|nr:hypothetical protein IMSAGC004_02134 [Bacteroidaceae bacterium]